MTSRPLIDISRLPDTELDHRSAIWWANLLLLAIETTMFALLVGGYFYLRGNFETWPPPHVAGPFGIFDPVPALRLPTINLALLVLTLVPMICADRAAWHMREKIVTLMMATCIALGLVIIALRFREFSAFHFRWDDNAYASMVWTITGMHLLHLIVGTAENVVLFTWLVVRGMDAKHARDVQVGAVYWYWIVGVWVLLYAMLFIGPRHF
jgi:heme/copper-type cytochrome/quinol oxidase subunit 3